MNIIERYREIDSEENALVFLYESIIALTPEQCNELLPGIELETLSTDAIVHILNAASSKSWVSNWRDFRKKCRAHLEKTEGKLVAADLMKVCRDKSTSRN